MSDKRSYELVNRETLFQGYFRVDRYHVRHERFQGGWTDVYSREVFQQGRAASVLLFDPQRDKVVMIEEFRAPLLAHGDYPWYLQLVSGVVEARETPADAIRREATEEANCTVTDLAPIARYYPSPGAFASHTSLFIGRTQAPEHGFIGGTDLNEETRVHVLDAMQAINLLYGDTLRDAATIIALQWFALRHTDLRSRWLVSDVGTPII